MITHLLYQILNTFKIGSELFRKVIAATIAIMLFGLAFAVIKFTKIEIPNFTRNLIILAAVDLGGFAFIMWRKASEIVPEEPSDFPKETNETQETHENFEEVKHEDKNTQENTEENVQKIMEEMIAENKEHEKKIQQEMSS